ncbi:unnamed protein product [Adineta steineri]|uniref:Uncharacterized protein n=1 Tax=Adineta steineri TaxID=433720 RepID=A0A815RLD5_9BILA|nr:unnamed protein product [Adineta steineri]CAF1478620.1 unnamed protein product [Adineta steineri]
MRSFCQLILFSVFLIKYSSSKYIFCTSKCSKIIVPFNKSLWIPVACQENTDIYDIALICTVHYRIDYDAKHVYIDFIASNDTNNVREPYQTEFLIQTVWLGFNEQSGQPNITDRQYECNTQNDCARLFYLSTIQRLITDGKLQLDEIRSKLYKSRLPTNKSKHYYCKDNSKRGNKSAVICKSGLCSADNTNMEQHCAKDNSPTLFSNIEYHVPRLIKHEKEVIQYKCNKNLCNKNDMIVIINQHLRNYTYWYNMRDDRSIPIATKSLTICRTVPYYLVILSSLFCFHVNI